MKSQASSALPSENTSNCKEAKKEKLDAKEAKKKILDAKEAKKQQREFDSASNSAEKPNDGDDVQIPKKTGIFSAFRNRSHSDSSKKKGIAIMATMKNAIHSGLTLSRSKGPRDGSAHPVKDGSSHTKYYHSLTTAVASSSKNSMMKVMDVFRNRSHQNTPLEDRRKRAAQQKSEQGARLRQKSLDPVRRSLPHRGSDVSPDPHQAAILFRNSRGLPAVDPFLEKVKIFGLKEDAAQIIVKFFKFHKCYDLMPTSAKVVVFDRKMLAKKAFFALVYNGVRAAPLWDRARQEFIGMLTITDFIEILRMYYKSPEVAMLEIEEDTLDSWRELLGELRPLISIGPDASLFDAIKILITNRIHRLPVIDNSTGNVLHLLTLKKILRFMFLYIGQMPKPSYMNKTLKELKIGTYDNIETASEDTSIILALNKLIERRVSTLPIVDPKGRLLDIYAKFDVINLAAEKTYNDLDVSLKEANVHKNQWFEGVYICQLDETLFAIMERIVRAEVHRLFVVNEEENLIGVISLSDLLLYLVLRPCDENVSDGATLNGSELEQPVVADMILEEDELMHEMEDLYVDSEYSSSTPEVRLIDSELVEVVVADTIPEYEEMEDIDENCELSSDTLSVRSQDTIMNDSELEEAVAADTIAEGGVLMQEIEDIDEYSENLEEETKSSYIDLPDSPRLDKGSLNTDNPILREVAVFGGE